MHPLEPIARSSFRPPPSKEGFSLLELLLVVAILSSVAFVVTSTVTNDVSQVRYEDTRNRLTAIRRAIVGSSNPELWAKGLQSGYVVDNGRLPENIDALVTIPTNSSDHVEVSFHPFGIFSPYFSPYSDSDSTDEISVDDEAGNFLPNGEHQLMKGHRGAYLYGAINSSYRDGWGTKRYADDEEDAANHGWNVYEDGDELIVESFGMDGESGPGTGDPYEADMFMSPSISSNDCYVELEGRSVTVFNRTGYDLDLDDAVFRVSLLIYLNGTAHEDETGFEEGVYQAEYSWRRVGTATLTKTYLDGTGDLLVSNSVIQAADHFVLQFPELLEPIPIGEHLLVLSYLPEDGEETANLEDLTWSDAEKSASWIPPEYVTKRVKFYARGGVPDLVLEIR